MKLIINDTGQIVGEVQDAYVGPMRALPMPDWYVADMRGDCIIVEDAISYAPTSPAKRALVLHEKIVEGYLQTVQRPAVTMVLPRVDDSDPNAPVDLSIIVTLDGGRDDYFNFKEEHANLADGSTTTIRDAANELVHGVSRSELELIYKTIYRYGRALHSEKWLKDERVKAALNEADPDAALSLLEMDPAFLIYGS